MPDKNVIVAPVLRINPSVTKRGTEMLEEAPPDGFSIDFKGEQTARLLPDARTAGILDILEGLRKLGTPAYIEYHLETKTITKLLIPLVSRVTAVSGAESEKVQVELEMSSARHVLKREIPDFEVMLKNLQSAEQNKTVMIVTETDEHEIIDVRSFPEDYKTPTIPPPSPVLAEAKKAFKWWNPFSWFTSFCWCHSISKQRALQIFNMLSATSCDPLTVPPPCIPFLYPDDGCWGRAHEMYRLMLLENVVSKKIWIYGSLHTNTRNNPNCIVHWGWHVASTVCVRRAGLFGWFFRNRKVMDPALFSSPVTKNTWKSVQGDSSANLVDSDGTIFYRNSTGSYTQTDPTYAQTNTVLATYRLQLQNRSLNYGPPPYPQCP